MYQMILGMVPLRKDKQLYKLETYISHYMFLCYMFVYYTVPINC